MATPNSARSANLGAIAGLFECLATSLGTVWGLLFFARLWMGAGFGAFQPQTFSSTIVS